MQSVEFERRGEVFCAIVATPVSTGCNAGEQAAQCRKLTRQNGPQDMSFCVGQNGIEGALISAGLPPNAVESILSPLVEQHARNRIEPFITCRSGDPWKF